MSLHGQYLKIIGFCYVQQEEKETHKYGALTSCIPLLSNKQNEGYYLISIDTFSFVLKRIGWDENKLTVDEKNNRN